jgi:hypothetical protein
MRAEVILRQVLAEIADHVHRARLNAVVDAVLAVIRGGEIALSALGRSLGRTSHKHGIKRADRLLGNAALAEEVELFYRAVATHVLRSAKRPVILVDWTESGRSMCSLTAAVPVQGRAIVIHSMTLPLSKWTSRIFEDLFLEQLRSLIGENRKPILVGDAGFRAPWMCSVKAMGWDFVARIRGRVQIRRHGDPQWRRWTTFWSQAKAKPCSLGSFAITKQRGVEANLIVLHQRPARARSKVVRPTTTTRKRAARAHREPLFLATTLQGPAKEVAAIYATRMQIELAFRDLKSHRYGWGFGDARSRSVARISVQIMLTSLASFVCMLVGIAVESAGRHRRFQANTETKRRVLSLVWLGREVIRTLDYEHEHRLRELVRLLALHLPFVGIR